MKKEKVSFERIVAMNRWKQTRWQRNGDWVIVGIQRWYSGPESFCYKIALFGIDIQVWFSKKFINDSQH